MTKKINELKSKLTAQQYDVCFLKGTEPPFSGKLNGEKREGVYSCVVCGNTLFSSSAKFNSFTGWPSFDTPETVGSIETEDDFELGVKRIEVKCRNCGSHLGHEFNDGPTKTGKRFCINSLALDFNPGKQP